MIKKEIVKYFKELSQQTNCFSKGEYAPRDCNCPWKNECGKIELLCLCDIISESYYE